MSESCRRGVDFERIICDNCNTTSEEEFKQIATNYFVGTGAQGYDIDIALQTTCKISNIIKGGEQQVKVCKDMEFGNEKYHLLGYADIVFPPNKIIDIKTTSKYTEGYNYVKRSQHYLYSYCTGINTFEYLVADYKESLVPRELHRIEFNLTQDENKWVLEKRISEMMSFIRTEGLYKDYCEIFTEGSADKKN